MLEHKADIYLMAGVATRPSFFLDCMKVIERQCRHEGWEHPNIHILYPYGDYTRSLVRQIMEVRHDLSLRRKFWIGAHEAVRRIKESTSEGRALLIGHSGGGVAAYHAGRLLLEQGSLADCRIVQIGSPKVRIVPELRDRISYFYAVDQEGRRNDAVTRLGSWGGFTTGPAGVPVWDKAKYSPGYISSIQVVGGHADYFRSKPPFIHQEMTNLSRTMSSIWEWLKSHSQNTEYIV